jgi:3,4-dihydroxy 2-butanone 4-phosphate synthase / GTP cyclohydrolase II
MTDPVRTDPISLAVSEIAAGRPVVVLDAPDRENEGDLVMAADAADARWLAFFVRYSSGVVCAPLPGELADRLALPQMVRRNAESMRTAYTVSVDARDGVGTGISAADRARTLRVLADPSARPDDLVRPGHVFPLRARDGGVRERPGHTEAAVDLARLAGRAPVGVIAELQHDDGTMMRAPACRDFADEHGLALVTIADLAAALGAAGGRPSAVGPPAAVPSVVEPLPGPPSAPSAAPAPPGGEAVVREVETVLPTAAGDFRALAYRDVVAGTEHVALVAGPMRAGRLAAGPSGGGPGVLVRVHSECLTGDAFGSLRCDCGPQLQASLAAVAAEGRGVVLYLRGHEGRGIGLLAKLAAYALQDAGQDTVEANLSLGLPADARAFDAAAAVLADLGVGRVRLLTNNPAKVDALTAAGIDVVARVPLEVGAGPHNHAYLRTKRDKLGHRLTRLPGQDRKAGA